MSDPNNLSFAFQLGTKIAGLHPQDQLDLCDKFEAIYGPCDLLDTIRDRLHNILEANPNLIKL